MPLGSRITVPLVEQTGSSAKSMKDMVRRSGALLKEAGITKALFEFLVCPLSKQPLRYCPETNSLISDAVDASFPIVDGIPRLVPKDGKLLETNDTSEPDSVAGSSVVNK